MHTIGKACKMESYIPNCHQSYRKTVEKNCRLLSTNVAGKGTEQSFRKVKKRKSKEIIILKMKPLQRKRGKRFNLHHDF